MSDLRESPALDILESLLRRGAIVTYTDPYVPSFVHAGYEFESVPEDEVLESFPDCIVIATDHDVFNYQAISENAQLLVDTRNVLKDVRSDHIFKL